ncbi:1-acyl-sn-glycerol-3-phosphate acyltransferase [Rhizosaccharibacter radicis]|uniref:1-acyl-sn-glycerol-3-phosphate acyltransferase n=1 Tax=Rhizosaccharibacter radicis TaxID=2782605 RepID=A0ABT1VTY1_9PROT|nr:1-acyl-sn-glycerol-3-phosphate acyltransferase [Acetobacteraceae bacterium KSS12]
MSARMQAAPRRLGQRISPDHARPGTALAGPVLASADPFAGRGGLVRPLRAIRRGLLIAAWTGVSCVIQSVLLLLPGQAKVLFARFYWRLSCRMLGMRVRMVGEMAGRRPGRQAPDRRPVVYACNHSSWIDVPVLGGQLLGCFVAKEDVGGWPVIGLVARLGRTVFVSRQRNSTGRERDDMHRRLREGDDLVLFPEGTSSDGSRVLPFHSSFFALAKPNGAAPDRPRPLVQPVSIVYDRLGGLPLARSSRTLFAWYGDMDLAPHFWVVAQQRGMRASVLLHPVLDPADFPTRKALAQACWDAVSDGAALLRQNRPVDALAATSPGAATLAPLRAPSADEALSAASRGGASFRDPALASPPGAPASAPVAQQPPETVAAPAAAQELSLDKTRSGFA